MKYKKHLKLIFVAIWLSCLLIMLFANYLINIAGNEFPIISTVDALRIREGMYYNEVIEIFGKVGTDVGSGLQIHRYSTYSGGSLTIAYLGNSDNVLTVMQYHFEGAIKALILPVLLLCVTLTEFLVYRYIIKNQARHPKAQ